MAVNNFFSASIFLVVILLATVRGDINARVGGGDFTDGDTVASVSQYTALNIIGGKSARMNIYPWNYYSAGASMPTHQDAAMLQAYSYGMIPMFLFEYYGDYNDLGGYDKWFAIGRDFATRFRPNSPWLISQGISNWGVSVYSAINEPDNQGTIPRTGTISYYTALEGLADGVHSVDATLKVIPGGFMAENAYSDHTLNGYGTAIAPLLNSGKLDGIDLHTYNDIWYAPIVGQNGQATFDFSPQSDFDSVKAGCGITRDINFYTTEWNFPYNPDESIDQNLAAKRFLTCFWANVGVVKNDGHTLATGFSLVYYFGDPTQLDAAFALATQVSPWTPNARGVTYALILQKTTGMDFISLDPKGRGEYILQGSNKKMWVWQNYPTWSSIAGTSYTVTGIPTGSTTLQVYGWNGLRSTYSVTGLTSYTVTGLATLETYMFLVDNNGAAQPDLIITAVNWTPASPTSGQAVTFSATVKNQGTAATPAGTIIGVGFDVDGVGICWSDNSTTSLAAGASRTLIANSGPNSGVNTWTATSGSHWVRAWVDDVNRIPESNENNNQRNATITIAAPLPDLIVQSVSWSPATPATGQAVTFSVVIKNQGAGATPAGIVIGVGFDVDGVGVSWSDSSSTSLAAGATRTLTANSGPNSGVSTWTATTGTHWVRAWVDDVNRIAETNENNNQRNATITIAAPIPDLIVQSISWSPATPTAGQAVTFSAVVKNQGTGATPAGTVIGVGFEVDGVEVTWSDTSTTSLAAGSTRTLTATGGPNSVTWPATSGTHTILAWVDDVNRIAESNENNNQLTKSMTV